MISPKEVRVKAAKWWKEFLQAKLDGNDFFPKEIPQIGLVKQEEFIKNFLSITQQFDRLIKESKDNKGSGYLLEWEEKNFRSIGKNRFIRKVYFEGDKDYLKFIGKEEEFRIFTSSVEQILEEFPELRPWIFENPLKVIENGEKWEDLLKVCRYFKFQYIPDRFYIRELPIKVHTKFVEENKALLFQLLNVVSQKDLVKTEFGTVKDFEKRFCLKFSESLIRVRILDKEIARDYFSGLTDITVTESEFSGLNIPCDRVFILENKTNYSNLMNFLTLPLLERSIGIFGSGFKVGDLKNSAWLQEKELYYWGDIDVQGFQILSQLRGYFPNVKSFLMDERTFELFEKEVGQGTETSMNVPGNLTNEEVELYQLVKKDNLRLEQEKVPHEYVVDVVKSFFI